MHSNTTADSSVVTFILAGGQGKRLSPFTSGRAKPLVPFGGAFRIIDFTLSNCVNSGIDRAYLLTQYKAESIRQYIDGSSWTTDFVCLPPRSSRSYRGTADSVYQNLDLIQRHNPDYVLILAADHIYKMDYRKLIQFHVSHGGEATLGVVQCPRRLAEGLGVVEVNKRGQVVDFEEKPDMSRAALPGAAPVSPKVLASMGIYVFNTSSLRQMLLRDAGHFNGSHEFGKDILPNLIRTDRVFAYDFTNNDGPLGNYWRDVGTIDCYHRTSMELLLVNSAFDPYNDARWPIYAGGQTVPLRNMTIDSPWVADSIVSPDAEVSGATILQSVISSAVHVGAAAQVQGSVLMPGVRVGRDARIRHAIVGEGVVIPDGEKIGCDAIADSRRFLVTGNGVVIVDSENARTFWQTPSSPTIRKTQIQHTAT